MGSHKLALARGQETPRVHQKSAHESFTHSGLLTQANTYFLSNVTVTFQNGSSM